MKADTQEAGGMSVVPPEGLRAVEFLSQRRSVRHFSDKPIPYEVCGKVL